MNVAIVGATRGMGRSLARLRAEKGDALVLMGRDLDELERSAADVRIRGRGTVHTVRCDLESLDGIEAAVAEAFDKTGRLDVVIVTAAMFGTQDQLEADTALAARLLTVNLANTVAFCEHARRRLLAQGGGTLVVFSSVAGDRGRKPVGIYGASKAGLSHYLEALDHRYRAQGLITICVKPGFVKTGMTAGLKPPPFAGEPDAVAARVSRAIDAGTPLVYAPAVWGWIMAVIKRLPRLVMRKINF